MDEKAMTRLLVVESDVEANFYKGALEDHGIKVMVSGIDGSALGAALDGPDEIEVFVHEEDVEKAKGIVVKLLEEEGEPIPAWTCKCGEEVDEGFGVCWSCGSEHEPQTPAE